MARKIDEEKLIRIKAATMKTIVEKGIEGATIAMIAKNANVSGGYLYRLYRGKQALIDELYFDKVNSLNNELEFLIELNPTTIAPILKAFIQNRIVYALNEPVASKFFYQLLHNVNFKIPSKLKKKSILVMEQLNAIGQKSGEISMDIEILQLHFHVLVYVVDYIHFKRTNFLGIENTTNNDVNYLTNNILNILKKDN
ncbi:TetR/AcrR family transcriptional regulator [Lutibacter sp. TH_r2]|uniref:TetR/AcrR family transcriptional regulator n=1 Tax=Lutibacter sp. TH_r2 TaxID=3082083 RepID=UPI002954A16C|nr:TetR/AcrR family transcriptional regulator [Lutibacter sp. TH_r2]MDV7188541.1 TetR/AcrR family transcriptional regulator [Lutibacter sp. TH_r2]